MKRKTLKATAIAAALALGTVLAAGPVLAHGSGEPGEQGTRSGSGMHGGNKMGAGMMGGPGHGMQGNQMGTGMMGTGAKGDCPFATKASLGKDLTVEGVTKLLEQRLSHMGNKRLKVGEVTVKDDDTITAEIVTIDDSLVQKMEFDRNTGQPRPVR